MGQPKFVFTNNDSQVNVTASINEYLEFFATRPEVSLANASTWNEYIYGDGDRASKFAQGTVADLAAPTTDFRAYDAAKSRMQAAGIMDSLRETAGEVKRRSRAKSEHDGEWNYDARWDIQPFTRREVQAQTARIINLEVYTSYSANVPGSAINDFCTYVAALVELIESRGVMVSLKMINEASNVSDAAPLNFKMTTIIKSSDQYLAPGELLRAMSANFYRRVNFMVTVWANELLERRAAYGLGQPKAYPRRSAIDAETGTLALYSMPFASEQVELMQQLTKLIQEGK